MIATHMKCGKKILCWILAAFLVLAAVIPLSTLKASAASGITVVKKYLPDNDPAGRSEVGEFIYNGEPAFCMQHKKHSPSSGSVSESEVPYNNPKIAKALYYGWGGPAQWSDANGPTKANKKVHYEPAVFYMHVVNEDAAKNLKEFWNSASINIYRNLDQHPDLEDHDNDKVVQKYPIGTIEITDKDKLFGNTVKTGDTMRIFLPLTIALLVISGTAAAMAGRKRKMEK